MTLASQSLLFCTDEDAEDILSVLGVQARTDDDAAFAGLDSEAVARIKLKLRNRATARVKFYCGARYANEDLATSWLVNDWASTIYAALLCARRGEDVPKPVAEAMEEAIKQMEDVRAGRAHIPDIGTANPDWPSWSNVTVDPRYRVRQIRVQRALSERTPRQHPQAVDWRSEGAAGEI